MVGLTLWINYSRSTICAYSLSWGHIPVVAVDAETLNCKHVLSGRFDALDTFENRFLWGSLSNLGTVVFPFGAHLPQQKAMLLTA